MPSLGKIEEFNPALTNINRYLEHLEQYFVANGVPADSSDSHKRHATLISVIGSKPYDVLADVCSPVSLSQSLHTTCNHSEESFRSKDPCHRRTIPISQL